MILDEWLAAGRVRDDPDDPALAVVKTESGTTELYRSGDPGSSEVDHPSNGRNGGRRDGGQR